MEKVHTIFIDFGISVVYNEMNRCIKGLSFFTISRLDAWISCFPPFLCSGHVFCLIPAEKITIDFNDKDVNEPCLALTN